MEDPTKPKDESRKSADTPNLARHWSIPIVLLGSLFALSGGAGILGLGVALAVAYTVWTNFNRRPPFETSEFLFLDSDRQHSVVGPLVSAGLSLFLLLALVGALREAGG